MIFGIAAAVSFLTAFTILFLKKGDQKLKKAHCIPGFAALALSLLHFICTLKLWNMRPNLMIASGCVILGIIVFMCLLFIIKKNNPELHKILAFLAVILLSIHIYFGFKSLSDYKNTVSNINFESIDISEIENGVYEGECDAGYIYAKVRVKVLQGKIINIDILDHRNERGSAAEKITEKIISEQKIEVDAVASATNSSIVIKKAVENALRKEKR